MVGETGDISSKIGNANSIRLFQDSVRLKGVTSNAMEFGFHNNWKIS